MRIVIISEFVACSILVENAELQTAKTTLQIALIAIVSATSCLPVFAELGGTGTVKKTVVVAGSPDSQAFSQDRPDYLHFKDDKIVVEVRSDLFSQFDTFKFFLSASHVRYDCGKKLSDIQVNTTPVTLF